MAQVIISRSFNDILKRLKNVSIDIKNNTEKEIFIIGIVFLLLQVLVYIIFNIKTIKIFKNRLKTARKLNFIIPSNTLIIEDTYIKMLRALENKLNVLK